MDVPSKLQDDSASSAVYQFQSRNYPQRSAAISGLVKNHVWCFQKTKLDHFAKVDHFSKR
jgi:hypothetical protein